MTEDEWFSCSDPTLMLAFLHGRASDRQLRLFACAACHGVGRFVPVGACRQAVEVSHRFADGDATPDELAGARAAAIAATDGHPSPHREAMWAACETAHPSAMRAAKVAAQEAREQVRKANPRAATDEAAAQAGYLRDIIGNPFRPARHKQVRALGRRPNVRGAAEELHESAPQEDMRALADLLEELDCTDADVLDHCRSPGPHVAGCWVLSLLLDKERKDAGDPAELPPDEPALPEVEAARRALARYLGDRRYRRLLRKVLSVPSGAGSDSRDWTDFLAQHPQYDTPSITLAEVGRVCCVHGCGVFERVVIGRPVAPVAPWQRAAYQSARGTRFPYAHPVPADTEGTEERVVWFCRECQEAWIAWDRLREEFGSGTGP